VTSIINSVCVRDAYALLLLRILCSFFFFFFFISLFRRNMLSLLLSVNRRHRIKTLTQLAEWSLFVVDYFYSVIWPKVIKLQLFEITLNTAARQSAHCCCMQLARSLPLHALNLGRINRLTSRLLQCTALLADRRLKTHTELLFFRNSRM